MKSNKYGFINAREVFEYPAFIGKQETINKRINYYSDRNRKDEWTLDSVLEILMNDNKKSDVNAAKK